ncbi:MAG: glycerophosphodiester phosphodiesterase family protein [Acidimicrobiales bacterium]
MAPLNPPLHPFLAAAVTEPVSGGATASGARPGAYPIVYAHRGGAEEQPENSVAAFAHAVALGFVYLETDARLTADGVLVALHDDHLDRVSDRRGAVSEMTLAEVQQARLRHPDGSLSEERVPVLEELLVRWPGVRWNLDAKDVRTVGPLGDLLERLDLLERSCVGAFSDQRLDQFRRRFGPALCSVAGPRDVMRLRLQSLRIPCGPAQGQVAQVPRRHPLPLDRLPIVGGFIGAARRGPARALARLSVPVVDRAFIAAAHRRAMAVHVWTVNDPAEMAELLDLGVDGFMTDCPTAAAALMRARGQWPTRTD